MYLASHAGPLTLRRKLANLVGQADVADTKGNLAGHRLQQADVVEEGGGPSACAGE
jgi:hypothetical protein